MKKKILLILLVGFSFNAIAQKTSTSSATAFDIRKKVEPPIVQFLEPPTFIDDNGNNAIDALENFKIVFKLKNSGKGDALNLRALLTTTGASQGIQFDNKKAVSNLKAGATQFYELPITSDINTTDGTVTFYLEIDEPNGFGTNKMIIEVNTREFLAPNIRVVDHVLYSGNSTATNLELKKPFSLHVLVQNLGQGIAKNIEVKLNIPENTYLTGGDAYLQINQLAPGEKRNIEYEMILNSKYSTNTLPINIMLSESNKKYAEDWGESFNLNQPLAQQKIIVQSSKVEAVSAIYSGSLLSDVDKNIPKGLPLNSKKYALIIGCEDYAKYQNGLNKEVNVDFAANDALVFSKYAQKTLGYPQDQIYTLINATSSQIKQNLAKLQKAIEIEKGNAEVLFYYSGHGLPEPNTNIPYIIPVDVNGNNPQLGVSLTDVYSKLTEFPTAKATVVIDACFSGGARNKGLVALKGIKVKPKMGAIAGNLVVFASSKGTESSAVFKEKQHGYFTYFLLKNLQTNSTNQNFSELINEINYQVSKEVLKIGKTQTPVVLPGLEIGEKWKTLKW